MEIGWQTALYSLAALPNFDGHNTRRIDELAFSFTSFSHNAALPFTMIPRTGIDGRTELESWYLRRGGTNRISVLIFPLSIVRHSRRFITYTNYGIAWKGEGYSVR